MWLSVDPLAEKYPNIGSYVYCANNPVKYVDPDGREVKDKEVTSQLNGKFVYPIQAKAYLGFAKTKIGQFFLGKFAKKGQTIAGHTYSEDGEFHKNKIDLVLVGSKDFNTESIKDGETPTKIVNNRLEITIRTKGTDNIVGEDAVFKDLKVFCHEFFIHALQYAEDFLDDGIKNNSNIYKELREYTYKHQIKPYWDNYMQHFQERNVNKYLLNKGIPLLEEYMKINNINIDKDRLNYYIYNFQN